MLFCSGGAGFELLAMIGTFLRYGGPPEPLRTYREEESRYKSDRKRMTHEPSPRRQAQAPANLKPGRTAPATSLS